MLDDEDALRTDGNREISSPVVVREGYASEAPKREAWQLRPSPCHENCLHTITAKSSSIIAIPSSSGLRFGRPARRGTSAR